MSQEPASENSADELRRAFDLSFAAAPPQASEEVEDVLTVRVAGDPYVIRLAEITALVAARRVVPIPAATRHLLGLAGIRGNVVPVFGLASLLGYGRGPEAPRWMILCGEKQPVALAFSELEGHLRLPSSCLTDRVANTASGVRTMIDIPLIVAAIRNGPERLAKEQ
jgi:chemotaxis signal transduction protein